MKYYKGKYYIGIYEDNLFETCITVLDNAKEFSEFMEISRNNAIVILHKLYNNQSKYLILKNKKVKVEFIEKD